MTLIMNLFLVGFLFPLSLVGLVIGLIIGFGLLMAIVDMIK